MTSSSSIDEKLAKLTLDPTLLAVAVIEQAIVDYGLNPDDFKTKRWKQNVTANRDSAKEFLCGGPMLKFWCELAGYNTEAVAAKYRRDCDGTNQDAA